MIARALIFTLLTLICVSFPTRPAQADRMLPTDAYLSGRNCGGTSLAASLITDLRPAEVGGPGWLIGGAIDPVAGVGPQTQPSLAVSAAGAAFFAWQESRNGDDGDIFVADIATAASSGRRAVRVDDTGVAQAVQASPAMTIAANGVIHAVWQDQRGANPALYYATSADNGKSWSANSLISTTSNRLTHSEPALISGPDNSIYLIWLASGGASSAILFSKNSGAGWSDGITISSSITAGGRTMPRLAFDSTGGIVAAWEDRRSGTPRIYTARLAEPTGAAWGADSPASPLGASAVKPSLAVGLGGAIYIAYQGSPGIYLISSSDSGASWSAPKRVDDGDGNAFTNPQLAVDSLGGVHCIWCRLRTNVVADIVAARSTDGGTSWGEGVLLASTTGTADPLALIADRTGRVYAAWTDDRDGANQLHSALWDGGSRIYMPLVR